MTQYCLKDVIFMNIKRILSAAAAAAFLVTSSASASVLGTSFIDGYSIPIGAETHFCQNVFLSDQSGVGYQTENYIVYTPNEGITPVIGYGKSVYGSLTRTLNEGNRLIEGGADIIGGINADYFSFQTGVPMSNLIVDGEVISKDSTATYGFGVDEDGNGFMGENYIAAALTRADGRVMNIECINKYRQPYAMYLMNTKFSDQTHNTSLGLDIILDVETDELKIGEIIKGTVTYAQCYDGSIKIPEGTIVLTVDINAPMFDDIADIAVGEEVEISISAPTEPRWETAIIGMGGTGEYILSGGVVTPDLAAGSNPRTAAGITENGDIILYTIDGRQSGYSYGVRLSTLAERMRELGCVEAVNLDGGGSTTIVARLPGESGIALMNKPSDGSQRAVSTSIFLKNNLSATGEIGHIQIYPASTSYVMKGAAVSLEAKGMDTGYHPMDISGKVTFLVENRKKSTITQSGVFTARDSGSVTVYAKSGEITASHEVFCVESPTDIQIKDEATGKQVTALKVAREGAVNLSAAANYGYHSVASNDNCFDWSVSGNIGTIDDDGSFQASNTIGTSGVITVSAGDTFVEIKTYIVPDGSEDEDLLYSAITSEFDGETLSGEITNEYSIDTQAENLKITADGEILVPEYDGETFSVSLDKIPRRIRITATNDLGYTSVENLTISDGIAYENPFVDTEGNWARDILNYMYAQKLISGEMSDAGLVYNPQKEMTRSEFAVLICNFLGIDPDQYKNTAVPYQDMDLIPSWAENQFRALYALGILVGRDEGANGIYVDPLTGISRAEAFTIITRLLPSGLRKTEIVGEDKGDIPSWAVEGFEILMADGTVSGYEDGSLKPLNKLTKAEAAKLLYSLY